MTSLPFGQVPACDHRKRKGPGICPLRNPSVGRDGEQAALPMGEAAELPHKGARMDTERGEGLWSPLQSGVREEKTVCTVVCLVVSG